AGLYHARAGDVAAELRGVGHRVVRTSESALVHQVNDQLELVHDLEVGHLRGVAGLDHDLETGLDQFLGAAAQHGLLTERVGLGLFLEGGLDDPGAGAADALGVRQQQRLAVSVGVLIQCDQRGHALAVDELATDQGARALRRDHADDDVLGRGDQVEVDVQAVPEQQRVTGLQARGDVLGVDLRLRGVRGEHHDHVGPLGDLGGGADGQTGLLGLGPRLRALLQTDAHLDAGVAQAQRVRVPLAAVADDRDLAALDDRQIRIVVVEDLDCHFRVPFVCAGLRRAGVLTYLAPHASCGGATALTVGPRPPVYGLAGLP